MVIRGFVCHAKPPVPLGGVDVGGSSGFHDDEVAGLDLLVQKVPTYPRHLGEFGNRVGKLAKLLRHLLLHRVHVDANGAEMVRPAGELRTLEPFWIFTNSLGSKLNISRSYNLYSMELRPSRLMSTSRSTIDVPCADAFNFCNERVQPFYAVTLGSMACDAAACTGHQFEQDNVRHSQARTSAFMALSGHDDSSRTNGDQSPRIFPDLNRHVRALLRHEPSRAVFDDLQKNLINLSFSWWAL